MSGGLREPAGLCLGASRRGARTGQLAGLSAWDRQGVARLGSGWGASGPWDPPALCPSVWGGPPQGPGTHPSGPPSPSPQLAPDGIGFTRRLLLGERPGQGGDQPPRPQTPPQSRPPPGTHRGTAAAREGRRGGGCGPRGAALPGVLAATPALVCGETLGLCTTFALCRSTKATTQRGPPGPGSPPSPGLPWVCMRPRLRDPQTGRVTALALMRDAPSGCSQQERAGQALGARTPDRSLWADPGAHSGGQTPSLRATRVAQPRLAPCREAEPGLFPRLSGAARRRHAHPSPPRRLRVKGGPANKGVPPTAGGRAEVWRAGPREGVLCPARAHTPP